MPIVTVREDRCQGCGLCVAACPKKIMALDTHKLNAKGFRPAVLTDAGACSGCAFCATMCPETIITVEK